MQTIDDLLLDIDDPYAKMQAQRHFHDHQAGVAGAMEKLLALRQRSLVDRLFDKPDITEPYITEPDITKPDIFDLLAELDEEET